MPTDASSVAAAARSLGAALCGLLLLAGCGTTPAAPPAPEALPMRVSDAPKPPRTAQPLDEAVLSLTVALLDRARLDPPGPSGRHALVVDPLIDRATGQQTAVTRGMEQRIGTLVRARYPAFELRPFGTAALDEQPLILLGAITPVAEAGVIPASEAPFPQVYRIWAVLGDLRTGRIVSHETAWVRGPDVDMTPTAFFRDSPTWNREPLTAAYLRTCAGDPGEAIDPAYLRALRAQAHAADGVRAYEAGNPAAALAAYQAAAALPGGDQLRVRNGLYLANKALGRDAEAEAAFGAVVAQGLDRGELAVKFLFRPGTTAFWADPAISGDYPMWLRQIARQTEPRPFCLALTGHASPTGPAALNRRLSAARAEAVRGRLVAERPALRPRIEAEGVGASQPLIGTGTDDATDALDRRVSFAPEACLSRL